MRRFRITPDSVLASSHLDFTHNIDMARSFSFWNRKIHRWGAVACALPLLLVIITGLMLQLKKQVPWVQPPTQSAGHSELRLSFQEILEVAAATPAAQVASWDDVDRLDVRPGKGIVKIRCNSGHELQIDLRDGKVLSSEYRRSDFIESLHDGSFFGEFAKLGIFLPSAIILLLLWLTGAWLWYLPFRSRARKKRRLQMAAASDES